MPEADREADQPLAGIINEPMELFNQVLNTIKAMPEYKEIGGDDQKYYELVDVAIENLQDNGKVDEDYDLEGLREKLRMEWRDIEKNF